MQWAAGNAGLSAMMASVQLRLVAILAAGPRHESLLHRLLLQPETVRGDFLPLAPEDEVEAVRRALTDSTARYFCRCGYRFFIGNCGQAMEEGVCPACKARVGGANHALNANTRPDTGGAAPAERGYPKAFYETAGALSAPERGMMPPCTRVLDVVMHMCLAASAIFAGGPQKLCGFVGLPNADRAVDVCRRRVSCGWESLRDTAGGGDEDVFLLLHDVVNRLPAFLVGAPERLQTLEQRVQWETSFARDVAAPDGDHTSVNAVARVAGMRQRAVGERTLPLQARVDEISVAGGDAVRGRSRLFRFSPPKDRGVIVRALEDCRAGEHALLRYALDEDDDHANDRALLKYLAPLVRWSTVVVTRCSHRYTREAARNVTIREFLHEQEDRERLEVMFEEFSEAWGQVVASGRVTHVMELNQEANQATESCTAMHGLLQSQPVATLDSSLLMCCTEPKNDGALLWSMILHIAQKQNEVMTRVAELASEGVRALRDFRCTDDANPAAARVSVRALCHVSATSCTSSSVIEITSGMLLLLDSKLWNVL
jgi:hypothetical protein